MSNPGPAVTSTSNITQTPKTSGGYQMGQSSTDLIGFYGATPVAQRSGGVQAAATTTLATTTSPWGFTTSTQANAVVSLLNEVRATLVQNGMIAGA